MGLQLVDVYHFATALLIGALIGIEREKHKTEFGGQTPGVRTFILVSLAGAISAWLSREMQTPWILAGGLVATAGLIVAGYFQQTNAKREGLGTTTEMAAFVVCLLGALAALGYVALGAALGVAVLAVLAYKEPLHGLIRKIDRDDVYAGLKLLIASFIVLPLLPDRAVDPLGALNPYKMWWLVILISALSLLGYVATRLLGPNHGTLITGAAGGLVSSTAVSLSFARQSRRDDAASLGGALATGLLVAWAIMFIRVAVEVAVVYPELLRQMAIPLSAMGLATIVVGTVTCLQARATTAPPHSEEQVKVKNPFSMMSAARFALVFSAVLVLVKLVQRYFPGQGLYGVAALAGLSDVDAITLSMSDYARQTGHHTLATRAITIGVLSNTIVKTAIILALAGSMLKKRTLIACVVIVAAGVVAMMLV